MEREEREKRKFFRYPAAKPPIGTVERVNAKVRFTAPNGENYEVDLVKMRQRNLRTGNIRAVTCTSAGDTNHWFFDKNSTKTVSRWLPYSKPLQRVLDDAKKKCRCNDVEEEAESMEVTELNEAKEVKRVENAVEAPALIPASAPAPDPAPEQPFMRLRRAALAGDIVVVHCLLCVEQIQVFGQEIFDRRYPGFVLSKDHKSCIKMLLSRGAKLGSCAPTGKLLRKVDTDCLELWTTCFFRSASMAGIDLPEGVQQQILDFGC